MGINTRLKLQRYGEYNIKAPTKDDLHYYGIKTTKLRSPQHELFDKVIYTLRFPPVRGRYYKEYIKTVEEYMFYYDNATKQSQSQSRAQLIDHHLAGKLLYMTIHHSQYHGFRHFKYSWLFNALCAMRSYVINRKYLLGEINTNNTTKPWSAGFVPFPKPLDVSSGGELADVLYELIMPRAEYIHKRSSIRDKFSL